MPSDVAVPVLSTKDFISATVPIKKLLCRYLKDKICAKHKHKPLIHCIVLPRYLD